VSPWTSIIRLVTLGSLLLARFAVADLPTRFDLPGTVHEYATLDVAKQLDLSKPHPVLIWFHGTGGRPNSGLGKHHRQYVSVGMSYALADRILVNNAGFGTAQWELCEQALATVQKLGITPSRVVVAGMSKGGWTAFHAGTTVPDGPDAIAIFAAGKDAQVQKAHAPIPPTLAVLIGTGETDPNYPRSQLAVNFFKEAGARVSYEEWLGHGHTWRNTRRVAQWMEVEAIHGNFDELESLCRDRIRSRFDRR